MITYSKLTFVFFALDFTFSNLGCVSFFWAGANLSVTSKLLQTRSRCSGDGSRCVRRVVTTGSSLAIVWSSIPPSPISFTDSCISWRYVCMVLLLPCKAGMPNRRDMSVVHTWVIQVLYQPSTIPASSCAVLGGVTPISMGEGRSVVSVTASVLLPSSLSPSSLTGCCCMWRWNTLWVCLHRWPCWKS